MSSIAPAQTPDIKVTYSLSSNGQYIADQTLTLIRKGRISSVYYNNNTPDRFIDFDRQTIVKTLITKVDTVKVNTPWSDLELVENEAETDTLLGFPCKKARLKSLRTICKKELNDFSKSIN